MGKPEYWERKKEIYIAGIKENGFVKGETFSGVLKAVQDEESCREIRNM